MFADPVTEVQNDRFRSPPRPPSAAPRRSLPGEKAGPRRIPGALPAVFRQNRPISRRGRPGNGPASPLYTLPGPCSRLGGRQRRWKRRPARPERSERKASPGWGAKGDGGLFEPNPVEDARNMHEPSVNYESVSMTLRSSGRKSVEWGGESRSVNRRMNREKVLDPIFLTKYLSRKAVASP